MPKFVMDYSHDVPRPEHFDEADERLFSASAARNSGPILNVAVPLLEAAAAAGAPRRLIEIGSGAGQHAVGFAKRLPDWRIEPGDPNPNHVESIRAWIAHSGLENLAPPHAHDLLSGELLPDGPDDGAQPDCFGNSFGAVLAINVLHIAPWQVALALLDLAAARLAPGGLVIVYGPFVRGTAPIEPSNAAFDYDLRTENPAWGLRNTADIARQAEARGLVLIDEIAMPANNLILVITRASG